VKALVPDGGSSKRYSELEVAEAVNAAVDACAPDEATRDRAVLTALALLKKRT
jgi:hypothetical protein